MGKSLRRFLLYPLAATLPALGLMIGLGVTSAQASTAPSASAYAAALATAKAAIKQLLIGDHGTNHRVGSSKKIEGLNQVQSTNWSGYADTGSNFTQVSGQWTEPSASCGSGVQLAAFWVGIDGYSSGSVEQDGTLIECDNGGLFQFSWWEMYPTNAIQVVGTSVASGDHITASVVRSGTRYTLAVTDSTRGGNNFSTNQNCNCANSSAEWIAEAPSGSNGLYPLAHFSTWTLTNASVTENGVNGVISSFTDNEITMVNNSGQVKAQPGPLNGSGNSFNVTWERSS